MDQAGRKCSIDPVCAKEKEENVETGPVLLETLILILN